MMEWEKNKKTLKCTWEGQCLWCLSGPARNHTEFIPTGNRISYLSTFTLLKTQGDWQGHIWDVNKLQHKHQLSLSGMAFLTACRNHIDMPVCAQITVLFNIPRETSERHYNVNITLIYIGQKKKLLKVTIKVLFVSFSSFVLSPCSSRLNLFDQKDSKKTAILWNINCNINNCFYVNIFWKIINSCDAKLNFHQPLLQSSVLHDPSEIILICWYIINVVNSCIAYIWNLWYFCQDSELVYSYFYF